MIFLFPNLSTLQLALNAGLVPDSVAAAPAEFATDEEGRVWVQTSVELSEVSGESLTALGVLIRKSFRGASFEPKAVTCWPQILPLEKQSSDSVSHNGLTERTPVLFELPEQANLSEVVAEMLRLGNDRQAFLQQKTADGTRTLLQVKGPPYYTLLRAIDHLDGSTSPRAYLEQSPRLWVEYGYSHPLAERIQPPPGTFLLLSSPREWTAIEEGKFHDIYEALRFTIPAKPVRWEAGELPERLKVRLRLVRGGGEEPAELWVLSDAGVAQLEELVRSADDRLISRLAFAVGTSPETEGQKVVVVKIRPGKEPPPVLVLDGVSCRSYLRIPNLFLPVGQRLHPPLRRDAVKQLLAADANIDTWLFPNQAGQFVPQSLPDNAFRPLSDWVEYVLDSSRDALVTWMESMRFDFESFVCPDEAADRTPPSKQKQRETSSPQPESAKPRHTPKSASKPTGTRVQSSAPKSGPRLRKTILLPPSELQLKLQSLEQQFRENSEPLDSPAREGLWRELAETNMALGHKAESALCYVNGLWEQSPLSAEWIEDWYDSEAEANSGSPLSGNLFQLALSAERPMPAQLNLIAAHLIEAGFGESAMEPNLKLLGQAQQQLERFENFLPVRMAWLAWLACAKLAHNDVLTLARTRDRMLERLHQRGPSPELDLPGFLRSAGPRAGERFHAVQEAMRELKDRVQGWIRRELEDRSFAGKGQTASYANLMIAYGYSRVGLNQDAYDLLAETKKRLLDPKKTNVVHEWLFEAFRYRINQSLEGKSRASSLPEELMKPLIENTMDFEPIYVINSFRAHSRILQPFEQVSGYARFLGTYNTPVNSSERKLTESELKLNKIESELEHLSDIENRVELSRRVRELLEEHSGDLSLDSPTPAKPLTPLASTTKDGFTNLVLLSGVLPYAPRLGEAHASELLSEVYPTLQVLPSPGQQAVLLDKALFVAAHFGQSVHVRNYVEQLHSLFESASSSETAGVFGLLLGQSFRGLRKLGMRDEISSLMDHIDKLLEAGRFGTSQPFSPKGKKAKTKKPAKIQAENDLTAKMDAMTLRLNLAAGWFYFGNDERAEAVLDEVSNFLYQEKDLKHHLRRAFVRQYALALEHAPQKVALPKLKDVFEKLTGITKGFGAGIQDQYYAYELLEVVESVVLALVSDDMNLDPKARQLLDELEYSTRKRIHRDLDLARKHSG